MCCNCCARAHVNQIVAGDKPGTSALGKYQGQCAPRQNEREGHEGRRIQRRVQARAINIGREGMCRHGLFNAPSSLSRL